MSLSVLNQVVTCVCGNDIVITVGGDEKVNTEYAEKWFVTVDVKAMNKRKDCCHNRLNLVALIFSWGLFDEVDD